MLFNRKTRSQPSATDSDANAQFIQHLIHDIQGDFLGVAGLCQSMRNSVAQNKDITGLLHMLLENCRTYKYKLNNFLEFTRLQAGLTRSVRGHVNIRRLINQVIDEYESLWIEKDARVHLDISPALPEEVSCDEGRIQLIVTNLFVNAVSWSPAGSEVTVTAGFAVESGPFSNGKPAGRWTITVYDNGEGMTEQQLAAVFAASPADRAVLRNRTGLGLIVSRRVAEAILGGGLWLDSRPGKGMEVRLETPFYPSE